MSKAKPDTKNVWETTDTACLLRHKHSRKYYGRFTLRGKQKWINLDTKVLTVAKLRLPEEVKKMEQLRALEPNVTGGHASVGDLMEVYRARTQANQNLRESSKVSRETALKKIDKTWPGIRDLEPAKITPEAVQSWANRFKSDGTGFTAPNTKTRRKGNSATSVNRAIDTMRRVLDIALRRGQIHVNPVTVKPEDGKLKKTVVPKKLVLPSRPEAEKLIASMRESGRHGGWGVEASYLCQFLLMSGARIGEVPLVTWRHIEWDRTKLGLPGYKTETSARHIPLFPPLASLLRKIIEWRKSVAIHRPDHRDFLGIDDRVFRIRECQKTIDAACLAVGVARITHHDFRHLFATLCIEEGVPIPTVSRWMGHKDGGGLVMKHYGHLRDDHSQKVAEGLKFGNFN